MRRSLIRSSALLTGLLLLGAGRLAAQDSRAGEVAAAQAEKAANLHPYVPPVAERIVARLETGFFTEPGGWFPYFGSVYSGGGFTLGAGYRHFVADNTAWVVRGLYSIKNYKNIEAGSVSRGHAGGRLDLAAYAGWRDATEVASYGRGIATAPDDRANFRLEQGYATGLAMFRPARPVVLGAEVGYEDFTIDQGAGSAPSIEQVYDATTAPGLGQNPAYVHTQGTAAIDWRTSPGYTRRGGYYGATFHDYTDLRESLGFKRVDADVVQHIPVLRETWVVSLRGRVQTQVGDDSNPPFFLLPALGSGSTLRGYSSWRFRDRDAWLMSAEWRWTPSRFGLDMALFYDTGQVAPNRRSFRFDERRSDWGIGARFHGPISTPLRVELARGDEGMTLVFSANSAF